MKASHLDILVEEDSMAAFLYEALPAVLPEGCTFKPHVFKGKRGLIKNLESRLKGYAWSLPPEHRLVILIDRDQDDCHDLKRRIEGMVARAGLRSRSMVGGGDWQAATRIVCEELEAWYFGDWEAVKDVYPGVRNALPGGHRNSDAITGGTWETLERILRKAGYFTGGLRKVEAARAIGQRIDPNRNSSPSFRVFLDAVREAAGSG